MGDQVGLLEVERKVDLDPTDHLFATFRPRTIVTPPAPAPFDRKAVLAKLKKLRKRDWSYDFEAAAIPASLSVEEANAWLRAIAGPFGRKELKAGGADELLEADLSARPTVADVRERLETARSRADTPWLVHVLAQLLPADELVPLLFEDLLASLGHRGAGPVADGARRFLLPRLDAEAFAAAQDHARGLLGAAKWPIHPFTGPSTVYSLAPLLGLHAELRALVESWPDGQHEQAGGAQLLAAQRVVLGLGSPEEVSRHVRRLKLHLFDPSVMRGWLAITGVDGLDWAQAGVERVHGKEDAAALAEVIGLCVLPETARVMLALRTSKAGAVAGAWLDAHPGTAAAGLLATAAGRGALAEAAQAHLKTLARSGHDLRPLVEAAAPDIAARVTATVLEQAPAAPPLEGTPAWLVAPGLKPATLPAFAQPSALPPLVTEGRSLTVAHLGTVLAALRETAKTKALHPVVAAVRERCTATSRDAFGWALFERWLADGAAPKEKWAFQALGHVGSDASALRLSPLVRAWPGESQHQRAVTGLEVLRAIGTDTALMQLSGISQKVRFKGLKQRAQELMEEIARGRGLSRAELEDRIVPTCDLDERGTRVFDFGPRRFLFALGPELEPVVKDEAGKLVGALPKPGKKDDAAKAEQAVAEWKLLKKQVKEVAGIQSDRLEQAMVGGRRWRRADFEALLVRHPLLSHLVRLLVWAGHDAKRRVATFRVAEDGSFADAQDEPTTLEGVEMVSLVHPLHLSAEERAAWGQLLADYQVIPPFEQLGRPIFEATAEEKARRELDRMGGKRVPPMTLVGILDRTGWTRGIPQDAGVFYEHSRQFPGAQVTAVLQYDGIPIGGMMDWQDVRVERVFFVPGLYAPADYPEHTDRLALGDVDAVAVSEVLKVVSLLAEKAR